MRSAPSSENGSRGGRTGRRRGQTDTRPAILNAARGLFAEQGFDKTSIRAVAGAAGVDPALVHHYFGTKQALFAAAVELPIDPEQTLSLVASVPLEDLGATMVRALLGVWDSPAGPGVVAMVRSLIGGGETSLARTFLAEIVLERIRQRIATAHDDGRLRVALVASQLAGLLVTRKVLLLEPISQVAAEELVTAIGPVLQRYLTGDIGSGAAEFAARGEK
ncbi:TetR/AcrR family transcriptional regulator [Nocardia panacis]|uniref:TetR/AcrR family transcriptional regulator n=1 Tax=Nocardia panacis TaxID=2340916 RepID=A0A3A4K0E8_9NOCA|nr:TetR family transcriptional regulator [Nocardia panacis]RJO69311.1 TetR/AcrR family transcriptional regulator [Nocardia panacis]